MIERSAIDRLAIGRVIAKLDPAYVMDPHSKQAREESDRIGRLAISRLIGEHEASTAWDPK